MTLPLRTFLARTASLLALVSGLAQAAGQHALTLYGEPPK